MVDCALKCLMILKIRLAILFTTALGLVNCGPSSSSAGSPSPTYENFKVGLKETSGNVLVIQTAELSDGNIELTRHKFLNGNLTKGLYTQRKGTYSVSGNVILVTFATQTCSSDRKSERIVITPLHNDKFSIQFLEEGVDLIFARINRATELLEDQGVTKEELDSDCDDLFETSEELPPHPVVCPAAPNNQFTLADGSASNCTPGQTSGSGIYAFPGTYPYAEAINSVACESYFYQYGITYRLVILNGGLQCVRETLLMEGFPSAYVPEYHSVFPPFTVGSVGCRGTVVAGSIAGQNYDLCF